jgi:putative peptide zinc metalloprotease protein
MSFSRRFLLAFALVPGLVLLPAAPVTAADGGVTGDDNTAVAVNTEDGASIFRLAFSIRRVANGVIDETNSAYALASCTDCQTVALAFQVVLALGDVDVAVPENRAVAYNDQCVECVTYASATQIVLGFDRPTRFTAGGRQRLAALYQSLRSLEERAATMTVNELNAAVQAAKAELVAILEEELVEVPAPPAAGPTAPASDGLDTPAADGSSTTTTAGPTTTTTLPSTPSSTTSTSTTTSTTNAPGPVTTTTTGAPSSTTTTTTPTAAAAAAGESS